MHRPSFGQASQNSGARSPYLFAQPAPERSVSGLYEYVDDQRESLVTEDESAPDVIHVRYLNDIWSYEFPPYSIAEEKVRVEHVRVQVAEALRRDPSRVKLVYKDTELRNNDRPLKYYGPKQNSEIVVCITATPRDFHRDGHSDSDTESSGHERRRYQERQHSESQLRTNSSAMSRRPSHRREERHRSLANGALGPQHAQQPRHDSRHDERRTSLDPRLAAPPQRHPSSRGNSPPRSQRMRTSGHNSPTPASPRTLNSTLAQSPINANTGANAYTSTNTTAAIDPHSPMGKVQAIARDFRTDWLKRAEEFLSHPGDRENQEKQYLILTETIHQKVFAAGDQIDTDSLNDRDKEEVRAARKAMYAEANDLQRRLDRYKSS